MAKGDKETVYTLKSVYLDTNTAQWYRYGTLPQSTWDKDPKRARAFERKADAVVMKRFIESTPDNEWGRVALMRRTVTED